RRTMRKILSCAALALFLAPGTQAFAAADDLITPELQAAYQAVLANPTDADVNIRYAEIAESLGQNRKALSAYERVLINHPGHPEAMKGMQRVRRVMQPPFTKWQLEIGAAYETNPLHAPEFEDPESDYHGFVSLMMRDERVHFDHRWRTDIR